MGNKNLRKISIDGKIRNVFEDKGILRYSNNNRIVSGVLDRGCYYNYPPFRYFLRRGNINCDVLYKCQKLKELCNLFYDSRFAYIYYCIANKIYCYTDINKTQFLAALSFNKSIAILGGKPYYPEKIYLHYFYDGEDIIQTLYDSIMKKEEIQHKKKQEKLNRELEIEKEKHSLIFKEKILSKLNLNTIE